ncbi:MAG: transcriptional regulator [Bacteroidetes bacterium]|nr:transcriptional regulator [Bacteroidota bacterium]
MPEFNISCNLLMIEDNPADVRLMIEAIREAGLNEMISTRYAYDGDEAFSILESGDNMGEPFNMILLDLNMPKVNGKELLGRIKGDQRFAKIPVFIMTNSDYKYDMIDCYNLRADAYIQKPTDFKRLIDFFISVKRSLEINQRLSVFQIEKRYEEMKMAV